MSPAPGTRLGSCEVIAAPLLTLVTNFFAEPKARVPAR